MSLSSFRDTVFYRIERTIKVYRRFALENLQKQHPDLTINQGLLLSLIADSPEISQVEMATILFKDYAAITRMIELMVRRGYLARKPHEQDRRRSRLILTSLGAKTVTELAPVIKTNRKHALKGLAPTDLLELERLLGIIIKNCETPLS